MTETVPASSNPAQERRSLADHLREIEFDPRMIGMVAALAVIWLGFNWLSDGAFLTARNLWNLLVQTSSIAVMACGMVLVIVTRNIDLSVGSMLGFVSMVVGLVQVRLLPGIWGFEHPLTWLVSLIVAICLGGMVGLLQGALIAYLAIPSFIVTLGGLLIWRGAAWWVTQGQTIAPMDSRFRPLGGGVEGAIGTSASWAIGVAACVAICVAAALIRRRRKRFGFTLRPLWAEALIAALGCGAVIATVRMANSYALPAGIARRLVEAKGGIWPEGGITIGHGLAVPVLVALGVGIAMTFVAKRLRFGRYVYAIGGNPEAAELAGVNTRLITLLMFMVMGILAGVAACITAARLDAASNSLGQFDELYVIAATVIGGTSLAGGVGTIYGAMLGALVMQSLQSGMTLMNFDSAVKDVVVGSVLVFAVWIDQIYRRRQN